MLNLSRNSTPKQIKNHRNIVYWILTGILGQLKSVTAIQVDYIKFLENHKKNNTLKITLTDDQLEAHKSMVRILNSITEAVSGAVKYQKKVYLN